MIAAQTCTQEQIVAPFIDGDPQASSSERAIDVINPSEGRKLFAIPEGSQIDVERAVTSARAAFESGSWSSAAPSSRKAVLHKLADLIHANGALLDSFDAGEMGKPIGEVMFNAAAAAGLMRFYAEAVDKVMGDVYTSDRNSLVLQRRVPRGLVAAVIPWNFPTFNAVLKIAPALAAGNSIVLKPSELSSRAAVRLAHLAVEAGLPPGVLNVIPGAGETVGRALAVHMNVDMITFTGSSDVGKLMLQYSGQSNMKLVMAECGGKSPHIVFDDGVDLDAAADAITRFLLANQGQICSVGSRLLVERSIEATMVEKITERCAGIMMGNALDPSTTFGPVASAQQFNRVMNYIEGAEKEGATLAAGGQRALTASGGFFVEPTIFRNVSPDARIAKEEIFGPVLSVIPFKDEAEALRIANSTVYGLASYVWTTKTSTGLRMMKGMRSSIRINAVAPAGEGAGFAANSEPSGQSGIGAESGLAGMESYLRRQLVRFSHA